MDLFLILPWGDWATAFLRGAKSRTGYATSPQLRDSAARVLAE
jgi:hypothetical protein